MAITLHVFGDRVGCDYTTASRLLSGDRMPSTRLLARICTAFELDHGEALRTLEKDQQRDDGMATLFSEYLKDKVFGGEPLLPGRPDQGNDLTPGH